MLGVVISRADRASLSIFEQLLELESWTELVDDSRPASAGGGTYFRSNGIEVRLFDDIHVELTHPEEAFRDPSVLLFASRHAGETGPLLTAHFTGNFGPAELGGEAGQLAPASPRSLKTIVSALAEHAPKGYDVGIECTHHGPTAISIPSLFVEIGSDIDQWMDERPARTVARSILSLRDDDSERPHRLVGFGGGHYAPKFTRILSETSWSIGHICPEWAIRSLEPEGLPENVIEAAFQMSNATICVIDGDHPEIESTISNAGYRIVTERWVRTVENRALEFVDEIEERLGPVGETVRFGAVDDRSYEIIELPEEFKAAVNGIDRAAALDVIDDVSIAYQTEEGGSKIGRYIAVPNGLFGRELLERFKSVLEQKYDVIAIDSDGITVEETVFDPALARRHGVSEGPPFGRLASGETITIDGETVEPADVHRVVRDRFELPTFHE